MKFKKYHYSRQGLLIITALGIASILILFLTKIYEVYDINSFIDYIGASGIGFIMSVFFIIICIYVWISYILNVKLKPKKEVLYLLEVEEDDMAKFINNKGKIFYIENNNFINNKFYDVLKTRDVISEVIGESKDNFKIVAEKRSYWLNLYTPGINFENMFMLPIVYVMALPGILLLLLFPETPKKYGIMFTSAPAFFIFYDLIYKIKLKRNNYEAEKKHNNNDIVLDLKKVMFLFIGLIVLAFLIYISFLIEDIISKIILFPFILANLFLVVQAIASLFGKLDLAIIFKKMYTAVVIFFCLIIGIFGLISSIKSENYIMSTIMICFVLVCIYGLYLKVFKK